MRRCWRACMWGRTRWSAQWRWPPRTSGPITCTWEFPPRACASNPMLPSSRSSSRKRRGSAGRADVFLEDAQHVLDRACVAVFQEGKNVANHRPRARPAETRFGIGGRQPLERLVFFPKLDLPGLVDEGGEDDCGGHDTERRQIERLHRDVVQPRDGETGLLGHFPNGGLLRPLTFLDPSVDCLPRAGTASARAAAEHEDAPPVGIGSNDVDVDGRDFYVNYGIGHVTAALGLRR